MSTKQPELMTEAEWLGLGEELRQRVAEAFDVPMEFLDHQDCRCLEVGRPTRACFERRA